MFGNLVYKGGLELKIYSAENVRNIAVVGHGSEGKTTLVEAALFKAGHLDRMGRVEDGTTTTDYDPEETKRHISISTALAPVEWKETKINLIDAPGYFDFVGEQLQAMKLADAAMIVVGATSGIPVVAEKAFKMSKEAGVSQFFFINQMDREHADFAKILDQLQHKFGSGVVALTIPIVEGGKVTGYIDVIEQKAMMADGKGYQAQPVPEELVDYVVDRRIELVEAAAENDDELLEKYFNGDTLSTEEVFGGLKVGVLNGDIQLVLGGSALQGALIDNLLDAIVALMPDPEQRPAQTGKTDGGNDKEVPCQVNAPFAAQVIKTVADPFVGKLSIFRVYAGTLKAGMMVYNTKAEKQEKIGTVYAMRGKKQNDVVWLSAGDIGAVAKLQYTNTGDTLCDPAEHVTFDRIEFPEPCISMAISAKKKGEEDKVFGGLSRLEEEDPTFKVAKDPDTGETQIRGMGEMHLEVITNKLKQKFGVEAELKDPQVPYRETIRKAVKAEGKHKKQSGGHGQFGHVWIEFEPLLEGDFEFVDKVVGGVVPRNFIPAVEKGLRENLSRGVLAGYPMVGIRATLYDGSYHPVDSSEMAFKTAARLALRKGCAEASPVLLEPIMRAEVTVPDEYMGDVIGDMNRRRGRILGMDPLGNGEQVVLAEVPLAEMFKYATDLRSMTHAHGSFVLTFDRYEDVPGNIAQKVIEARKSMQGEED